MPDRADLGRSTLLLWTLLGIVLLAIGASLHYLQRHGEAETLRAAGADSRNLARAFAEHSLASFQRVDFVLHGLRRAWLEKPHEFADEVSRQQALMGEIAVQVGIIGADGRLEFSNLSPAGSRIDLADREHFRVPREQALRGEDRLFISRPLKGRVSGKWSIQIVRPIIDDAQRFRGVVVVSVDPEFFAGFYGSVDLGAGGSVAMVRDSGEILTRGPNVAGSIGRVLSGVPYLGAEAPASGSFRRYAQVDNTERIYGFHRLPALGVSLVVGLATADMLAPLHRRQQWERLGTAALAAVLLALALAIHRAQSRQAQSRQALAASEQRFRTLFESFTDTVFVLDLDGRLLMAHTPANRVAAGQLPGEALAPLTLARQQVMRDGLAQEFDFASVADAHTQYHRATLSALCGDGGKAEGFVLVVRDVTAERAAAESQRIAATTFESQEGLMITDGNGVILRVNRAFSELTGYAAEEVVGRTPAILKSGRHEETFYRGMWATLLREGYWQGEVWNRRKGGEVYPEWLTISAVADERGRTTHYVGAFSDISERKEAELRIRNLAFYDPLTGLPNRRLLLDRLQQTLAAAQRLGCYGAVLYLDLDHFKILNDTRGHDAGDELLVEVADRLRRGVREEDTVSRLGGDEFVVMLDNLGSVEAVAAARAEDIAGKMRQALTQPFALKSGDYALSPSIGVSLFHGRDGDVQSVLKQADMALYEAKEQGRNAVRFFSHVMQESVNERARILAGLRQAIAGRAFELYLQPQFSSAGERIGAEALLRWRHPERGLVMPDEFIPLAEDSGLIVPIGQLVLDQACAILAQWRLAQPEHCLSVNVSARQFHQPDFVDTVAQALRRHGIDGHRLCLELTESSLLGDVDAAAERMGRLKEMGIMISLDDFGTGYSSLSCLKLLPIDEVKIDRSFVADIADDGQDAAIVRAIIAMCRSLGITVIVEGVERAAQRDYLLACGCDALQGYLLGRPMPLADYQRHGRGTLSDAG